MNPDEPSPTHHPLLARLPVAAGAVCLRAMRADDIDDFLVYRSDPEVARYQGWQPIGRDAALVFLQNAAPPPWGEGDWAQIGIVRVADDRLVGDIGLLREGPAQVQIGFSLARTAQGHGWAQAAMRACIDQLLAPVGMTRLRGITDERTQRRCACCRVWASCRHRARTSSSAAKPAPRSRWNWRGWPRSSGPGPTAPSR